MKHLKMKQLCCACDVGLCLTMDGQLLVWGKGDMFGFKGIIFDSPIGIVQCGRVQQIAMNSRHALLLCSDGNVYSIGSNEDGKLGLGHENEVTGFNKIDLFDSIDVIKVQTALLGSAVLTKRGQVYIFGQWGEMKHSTPRLIEGLTDVVDISMSSTHILALTKENELCQVQNQIINYSLNCLINHTIVE